MVGDSLHSSGQHDTVRRWLMYFRSLLEYDQITPASPPGSADNNCHRSSSFGSGLLITPRSELPAECPDILHLPARYNAHRWWQQIGHYSVFPNPASVGSPALILSLDDPAARGKTGRARKLHSTNPACQMLSPDHFLSKRVESPQKDNPKWRSTLRNGLPENHDQFWGHNKTHLSEMRWQF